MIMVLALTVFVDLITAVGVGVVFAALAYVKQIAQLQIEELKKIPESLNDPKENELLESLKDKVSIFSFGGPLSFGAAADLGHHVRERVKPGSKVTILDFSRVPLMDVSAAMAVDTVTSDALAAGRQLVICGANAEVNKVLEGVNEAHPGIPNFDTLHDALLYAEKQVAGTESKNTRFQAATQS
jgi:SulP family sulfate permease